MVDPEPGPVTVTMNQPSFFPWVGEFEKLAEADVSICLDHVKYQEKGFLNRTRIAMPDGNLRWLTIPAVLESRHGSIGEVTLLPRSEWLARAQNVLSAAYRYARYRDDLLDLVSSVLHRDVPTAVDLAEHSLRSTADYLGLTLPARVRSSTLTTRSPKTEMILGLTREVGANRFIYGPGKRWRQDHYLDRELLESAGIEVHMMIYRDAPADGSPPPRRLSILDAIAHLGRAASEAIPERRQRDGATSQPVPAAIPIQSRNQIRTAGARR